MVDDYRLTEAELAAVLEPELAGAGRPLRVSEIRVIAGYKRWSIRAWDELRKRWERQGKIVRSGRAAATAYRWVI